MAKQLVERIVLDPHGLTPEDRLVRLPRKEHLRDDDAASIRSVSALLRPGSDGSNGDTTAQGPGAIAAGLTHVRLARMDLGVSRLDVYQEQYYMPSGPRGFRRLEAGQKPSAPKWWGARNGSQWQLLCHPFAVLAMPRSQPVLIGFSTSRRFESYVLLDTSGRTICLEAWCDLGGAQIDSGRWLELESLYVRRGDFNEVVGAFARHVATEGKARCPSRTVTGWSDWQYYREQKDEKALRTNLKVLAKMRRDGCPLDYVILDGGWCDLASEWLEPCDKFPSGMKAIGRLVRRSGMELGLWLAPFITNVGTKVAREHPDWMVTDAQGGGPLVRKESNVGEANVIDYSVPAAIDWLSGIVRTMVRDWKVRYIKLDGPSLAHYYGGEFHDRSKTATEVIRTAMEAVRREAGDEVAVEGEGLFGPSVGMVQTQRISQDNHPFWYNVHDGRPCMKANIVNEMLGSYMHGRLWHVHRENVILRDFLSPLHFWGPGGSKDCTLNENEMRTQLSASSMSGGAMLLTDPMDQLSRSPQRMELITQFLPHFEHGPCRAIDVFDAGRQPALYVLPIERPSEQWWVLGAFNWEDQFADFSVPLRGVTGGRAVHAFEFWEQRYLGCFRGNMVLGDLPAHGCRLIALRPATQGPQLVGTNHHVFQGAVELRRHSFDGRRLVIELEHHFQRERRLHVHVPPEFVLGKIETNAMDFVVDGRKVPIVSIQYNGPSMTRFELMFRKKSHVAT